MLDLGTQVLSRCLFPASTRSRDLHRLLRGRWRRRRPGCAATTPGRGQHLSSPLAMSPLPDSGRRPSLLLGPASHNSPHAVALFPPLHGQTSTTTLLRTPSPLPPSMGPDVSHNSPSHTTSPSPPLSMAPNVYHKSPLPRASPAAQAAPSRRTTPGGHHLLHSRGPRDPSAARGSPAPRTPSSDSPPNHSGVRAAEGAAGAAGDARPRRDPRPERSEGLASPKDPLQR